MEKLILRIILFCLIIATVVVGVLVAIKYIDMFKNNSETKSAMTSINEQYKNAVTNSKGVTTSIDATYKGHKVVRNNRNT